MRKLNSSGVAPVIGVIAVLVIALGGFTVWKVTKKDISNQQTINNSSSSDVVPEQKPDEPLKPQGVNIVEWGTTVNLPTELLNKTSYSLGDIAVDPDGNNIQPVRLLLLVDTVNDGKCEIVMHDQKSYIDTAIQILRVDKYKPFNATRYRGTFKENVLSDSNYNYHVNFNSSVCAGPTQLKSIESLQSAAVQLTKS